MQWLKRFCDNICRFRHGPKMSFSLTSNGWVFFTFPFKKGTFPFLPHWWSFCFFIASTKPSAPVKPMAKGGTKSTQCCGNSVGDAIASLRANDRGFYYSYQVSKTAKVKYYYAIFEWFKNDRPIVSNHLNTKKGGEYSALPHIVKSSSQEKIKAKLQLLTDIPLEQSFSITMVVFHTKLLCSDITIFIGYPLTLWE